MFYKLKYLQFQKLYEAKLKCLNTLSDEKKIIFQIIKFNHQWNYCNKNILFYKNLKKKYDLPNFISSLSELKKFPKLNKQYLKENYDDILVDYKNSNFTLTGGTSGEISSFPTAFINEEQNFVNKMICKNWINSSNKDKTLYIWGHSHKFGNNKVKQKIKTFWNYIKDIDQKRHRYNAYDMSEENLKKIHIAIQKKNFDIIFSYGSTFEILAKYLKNINFIYKKKIKLIFTSENITKECVLIIKEIFINCQIIGEYGMAETGIIGYSIDNINRYRIIWTDFIIQNEHEDITITEISNKQFPLINYYPDDKLILEDLNQQDTHFFISGLKGKTRPFFICNFSDDTKKKISLIIFDHICKNIKGMLSLQYYIDGKNLNLIYTGKIENKIIYMAINDYFKKNLNNINILRTIRPIKTVSGKLKTIIDEKDFGDIKNSFKLSQSNF